MTQESRRRTLIQWLLEEQPRSEVRALPTDARAQAALLRGLWNIREPQPIDPEYLAVQDAYLQEELAKKGITRLSQLRPVEPGLYLWRGDITTLACDAIVNAANSRMLGCFCPGHGCVDNAIHTFAGVQLRLACADLMAQQGHAEAVGGAKITPAFNLPCRYVLHTVGPMMREVLTARDQEQLASCYRSCLTLAEQNDLHSVAFCCISTGEFHFPPREAAKIAVRTVREYLAQNTWSMEVIFNVFTDADDAIYRELLGGAGATSPGD